MKFVKQFTVDFKTTGAVAPTSTGVARAMVDRAGLSKARIVVELGPGTGCITQVILDHMAPDARLLTVELNPDFVRHLKETIRDPRLIVIEDSAEDLPTILEGNGYKAADCIISAVPFGIMPAALTDRICGAMRQSLRPGGNLVALQYFTHALPRPLKSHFGAFRVHRYWLNLPPALLYCCTC